MTTIRFLPKLALAAFVPLLLTGCIGAPNAEMEDLVKPVAYSPKAQECLARAMYFESNRSSREGMLAVGTVVMNRAESGRYPEDVCSVVAQPRQFAPGVMTRDMGAGKDLAMKTAAEVLSGKRHDAVQNAMFFHTAGLRFGYNNMHYVAIAGGNAFYEKVRRARGDRSRLRTQSEVAALQKKGVRPSSALESQVATASRSEAGMAVALGEDMPGVRAQSPFLSLFNNRAAPSAERRETVAPSRAAAPETPVQSASGESSATSRFLTQAAMTAPATAEAVSGKGGRVARAATPSARPSEAETPDAVAMPTARP